MRRSYMIRSVAIAAVGIGLSAAAPLPQSSPLLPLSAKDTGMVTDAGCVFSFDTARAKTMFYSVENLLMIRTKAGLRQCRVPEPTMMAFRDAKGAVMCNGQRLMLKQTGKISEPAEGSEGDGSTYPATLSVGTGRSTAVVKGEASTAC